MKGKSKKAVGKQILSVLFITVMVIMLLAGIPVQNMSEVRAETILSNPRRDSNGVVTWDCVYFGNYPQSDATGQTKDPIKWRVLSVDGDDAFLISDQNLDIQRYHDIKITWENCTLRSWLNGYDSAYNVMGNDYSSDNFIDRAFTVKEQEAILNTTVENINNQEYGTEGGNNTQDKVFLLSYDEVTNPEYGFSSDDSAYDDARKHTNTTYVRAGGGTFDGFMSEGSTHWWLRSPGGLPDRAMFMDYYGCVDYFGIPAANNYNAVCPALHLNLASDNVWFYSGTVSSDGNSTTAQDMETSEVILSSPQIDGNGVVTWDCIYFGSYPQSDAKGQVKDPIKWRVLSVDGNDAFLVADQNLDVQKYQDLKITWENCTMRSWLNGYESDHNAAKIDYSSENFIDRAFTAKEQEAILNTTVENTNNSEYGTEGGNNTQDKVFLLSYDEVTNSEYGFSLSRNDDAARQRTDTDYVAAGGIIGSNHRVDSEDLIGWWLRSPGFISYNAMYIYGNGCIYYAGYNIDYNDNAVCPALHLNLSSTDVWSYAGTVSSDGSNTEGESEGTNSTDKGESITSETPVGGMSPVVEVKTEKLQIKGISQKIAAGKKITLTPIFTPTDATNQNLIWTSSNTAYATVDSKGVVTTKKKGVGKSVTITATTQDDSNIAAAYTIKIVKHAVKSIKLTAKNKTVKAGKKLTLKATIKTTGKTANKVLQWTSSNEAYATVTKKGVVRTKKAGKGKMVKITAKATDGTNKKATIKIKIK